MCSRKIDGPLRYLWCRLKSDIWSPLASVNVSRAPAEQGADLALQAGTRSAPVLAGSTNTGLVTAPMEKTSVARQDGQTRLSRSLTVDEVLLCMRLGPRTGQKSSSVAATPILPALCGSFCVSTNVLGRVHARTGRRNRSGGTDLLLQLTRERWRPLRRAVRSG